MIDTPFNMIQLLLWLLDLDKILNGRPTRRCLRLRIQTTGNEENSWWKRSNVTIDWVVIRQEVERRQLDVNYRHHHLEDIERHRSDQMTLDVTFIVVVCLDKFRN